MTTLQELFAKNSYDTIAIARKDIEKIFHASITAEKYKTLERAIAKIDGSVRHHDITKDMTPQGKITWALCIQCCIGALTEELEMLEEEN